MGLITVNRAANFSKNYNYKEFPFKTPPEISEGVQKTYPVVIVGAGPIGLSLAIDLAQRGIQSVLLDDNNIVSTGSRAICWAKRTLEIFDRLGVASKIMAKGITWETGRLFNGDKEVFSFNLLPDKGQKFPAFINLQQYYVEEYLIERCFELKDFIDLRFSSEVIDHEQNKETVNITVRCPEGHYKLKSLYMVACDGADSPTRKRMNLSFDGEVFHEHFLIVDIFMKKPPFKSDKPERWFWFAPSFHDGQSALFHKQAENIYRIDLQLDENIDKKSELDPQKVRQRIKKVVKSDSFEIDWMSIYKFKCASLDRMVFDKVIFVGDSAHVVSPFGARGGNGGIHDVDNLGWKLAYILKDNAPVNILNTYNEERIEAAKENIANSSRATNFMTPKNKMAKAFRDQVLDLSVNNQFFRNLINSGRLSVPFKLISLKLDNEYRDDPMLGSIFIDFPILDKKGNRLFLTDVMTIDYNLLSFSKTKITLSRDLNIIRIGTKNNGKVDFFDFQGKGLERYRAGLNYLIRPDGYIVGIFKEINIKALEKCIL
ncbi:FAD-dependent monooxygenase [Paracoccaceae bacterium]|nr:FAD-dependent monooxygenase [Paracoccaceae bacterium]